MSFSSFAAQVRHCHDFHHETGPACEVLRTLTMARLGVILFPCKARSLPLIIDVVDEISA